MAEYLAEWKVVNLVGSKVGNSVVLSVDLWVGLLAVNLAVKSVELLASS